MDDLHTSQTAMVANDQVDHADDVSRLDQTFKDLLRATESRCSAMEDAVEVRRAYTRNVKDMQECLQECGNDIPALKELGMVTEEKMEKCQVCGGGLTRIPGKFFKF